MSGRYFALLWGDLMVSLLLRLRQAPGTAEIDRRAREATEDFLRLYSKPKTLARVGVKQTRGLRVRKAKS